MGLEVAAISAVIGAAGIGAQAYGASKQYEGQKEASAASKRAEDARQQQMLLESGRAQRETIRKMQAARAAALDAGQNQGASYGSGVAGGISSITSNTAQALNYNFQATAIGADIFQANRDVASAQTTTALGQGIAGFGRTLTSNATQIAKDANSFYSYMTQPSQSVG